MSEVKNQRRRNKSLCEKSTDIAINITKLSSLYLARITLGSGGAAKGMQARVNAPATVLTQDPKRKKSVEPEESLASAYVMEPAEEGKGEGEVDTRAAEFIYRFKVKNQQSDPGIRKEVSKCIPPPPRVNWANYYSQY